MPNFRVVTDKASGGYRVVNKDGASVDGPFRDREDAVARAHKREVRDSVPEVAVAEETN